MTGRRASADERAERVNVAVGLLGEGVAVPDVVREVAAQFGLSERQARRYVERAAEGGTVEAPGPSVVFTVRLPRVLVARLRRQATAAGRTLSSVVAEAIEEWLDRAGSGRRRG